MIKIAVDLLGADHDEKLLAGAVKALKSREDLFLYLCGREEEILPALEEAEIPSTHFEILNSADVITNHDDPMRAFRAKPESSLAKAMGICKTDPEVAALVTCGATGAVFVGSVMSLPRIGKLKPILVCEVIRRDNKWLCISDCGANIDCDENSLLDFARVGSTFMRAQGVKDPKIGLLSNGSEDGKGNALTRKAFPLLKESGLNFAGNIEGIHVLNSDLDVVVCDGFSGNILLKTLEGAAKSALEEMTVLAEKLEGAEKEAVLTLAAEAYKKYDYNALGGAVLLGVGLPVLKGHGSANEETMNTLIRMAYDLAEGGLVEKLKAEYNAPEHHS